SDPLLSEMLHQVLNRISAIRSVAEILDKEADLSEVDEKRFVATINRESEDLTNIARRLVDYFDRTASLQKPISPLADLDESIIANRNHFPTLETAADDLRTELTDDTTLQQQTLERALAHRFEVECMELPTG